MTRSDPITSSLLALGSEPAQDRAWRSVRAACFSAMRVTRFHAGMCFCACRSSPAVIGVICVATGTPGVANMLPADAANASGLRGTSAGVPGGLEPQSVTWVPVAAALSAAACCAVAAVASVG